MASLTNITEVNKMSSDQFERTFGNVIELNVDAARKLHEKTPYASVAELCTAFYKYLDDVSEEEKIMILKLHPDLAGRMAVQGKLTSESAGEQRSAGLHDITDEQRHIINTNNERYKSKFGFPFIICARENKVQSIIDELEQRYNNTQEQEIETGINEVKKICRLRILDIVKDH